MKIFKPTKLIFLILRFGVNFLVTIVTFLASFLCISFNRTIYEIIFVSLPWSLFYALNCYYFSCAIFYQMAYFHIICYYLHLKLKRINKEMKERISSIKLKKLKIFVDKRSIDMLQNFHALYSEISTYNNQFWSKFIVLVYLIFTIILSTLLYSICFAPMHLIVKVAFIYAFAVLLSIFLVLFISATLIDIQVNETYKLLNQYFLLFKQRRANRIKVINL